MNRIGERTSEIILFSSTGSG